VRCETVQLNFELVSYTFAAPGTTVSKKITTENETTGNNEYSGGKNYSI